jgi:hypothetical protein
MVKKRFEFKYLVPEDKLDTLRNEILPFLLIDHFASDTGRNEYTVRSLYYDTMNFESYFEKIEGIRSRKKFRIRGYNQRTEESRVFLEIKNKDNNSVYKNRASLLFNSIEQFLQSESLDRYSESSIQNGGKSDAERFMFYFRSIHLRPIVLIAYEREAYLGKYDNSLRVTFDKNLRSRIYADITELYSDENFKPAVEGFFILEFKFYENVPAWFKFITKKYNLNKRALSKYTMSVDSHMKNYMMELHNHRMKVPTPGGKRKSILKRNFINV